MPSDQDKTFEELIALQLVEKSQRFRRGFYRWHLKASLTRSYGKPPTKSEIDAAIANQRSIKYGPANAGSVVDRIKTLAEIYVREMEFPMKFRECLRRIIGGRSVGNRLSLFRRYWAAELEFLLELEEHPAAEKFKTIEGRIDQANKMIESYSKKGVQKNEYENISRGFNEWRKQNRIRQRKNAAKKRWEMKK